MKSLFVVLVYLSLLAIYGCSNPQRKIAANVLPDDFVYLKDIDSSIIQEMRYAGDHNFYGKKLPGYEASECILTKKAALALKDVQTELKQYSLSLKVYDCYRPQKTVDAFVKWAADPSDLKMRKEFYPEVDKKNLFRDGYIASKSGHSRGSTVDLTVVALPLPAQDKYEDGKTPLVECTKPAEVRFRDNSLDFGTGFDCFDPLSHTANPKITQTQKQNRLMLKSMMEKNGFRNLAEEWWHFTLRVEPHADRFFNFDVR